MLLPHIYCCLISTLYLSTVGSQENCPRPRNNINLDFNKLLIGPINTIIAWEATCQESFIVTVCNMSEDGTLKLLLNQIEANTSTINISTSDISNTYYFRINTTNAMVQDCCPASSYYFSFQFEGGTMPVYAKLGENVLFTFPDDSNSCHLMIVWTVYDGEACICPLLGNSLSSCNCNKNTSFTPLSSVPGVICFSNLMAEANNTRVYFVESKSTPIDQRVIKKALQIIILEPPVAPEISFNDTTNTTICFGSTDYHMEYYNVSVTDNTGFSTSLSGTYNTSQCLNLTSDLVCGPFLVIVTAVNPVGVSNRNVSVNGSANTCGEKDTVEPGNDRSKGGIVAASVVTVVTSLVIIYNI